MKSTSTEYGIICKAEDERKLVINVNAFMKEEYNYRKLYRCKNKVMLEARLPNKYDHYFYQFLKQDPQWYFELYPNVDLDGNMKFKRHPEVGFCLFINKIAVDTYSYEQRKEQDEFFEKLLNGVGFDAILLHEYADREERL